MLKGLDPAAPITSVLLEEMPLLDAFVLETARLYPPARPAPRVLTAPLEAGAVALPAGTIIAPEPFVAHVACYEQPERFDPSRFPGAAASPLLPFATAPAEPLCAAAASDRPVGERLTISLAKASFVQLRRMFEEVRLGAQPPPLPAGGPLHTIDDKVEALLKAKMFYEIQRGVKKLRF